MRYSHGNQDSDRALLLEWRRDVLGRAREEGAPWRHTVVSRKKVWKIAPPPKRPGEDHLILEQ